MYRVCLVFQSLLVASKCPGTSRFRFIFNIYLPLSHHSAYRVVQMDFMMKSFIEPTNNVSPKKDGDFGKFTGWKDVFAAKNRTCWLTCQVTGFPVPRYQ